MEFPKRFERSEEERLVKFWEENKIFKFTGKGEKPVFVIDTPPPYPSGSFHMGNFLNWCYIDFIARYKRMRGFDVFFPQGWDVHGLPTEVKVEQATGKKCSQVERKEWIKLCEEWTEKHIRAMKEMMRKFGFSIDWSAEYRTSDPAYIRAVQLSFLDLREKGLVYRGRHPVNWCPRCETAIADAEVEYIQRKTKLNFIKFPLAEEGEIVIATTRPELLHACVAIAVNPEDGRYREIIGRYAKVPIFGQEVEIIASESVDPEFGTGIVMICTFGDKQDVEWVFRHGLPIIESITEDGKLKNAREFSGLGVEEAREKILEKLKELGYLLEQREIEQNVGVCWRCKTPIEIFHKEQWFVAVTRLKEQVIREAKKIKWIPEHYALRLIDWAKSMTWDWVISRQKVYGTPIPVWYCKRCGNVIFASPEQLPVDPAYDSPPVKSCPKCGSAEFEGERDTMDTWMDSSITIAFHAGWPDSFDEKLFPADLQPNGADIIRTWDYYLLVRHLMLFGKAPYKAVLVNGIVLGEDGRKMSKSLGNYVTAEEIYEKYSADAARFWAAIGGSPGSDVPFSKKDVEHGSRFVTKLWNIARFCSLHLEEKPSRPASLHVIDKWILHELQEVIRDVTERMENYKFDEAIKLLEKFVWEELADHYLEMSKYRIYSGDEAVKFALYEVLYSVVRMLSPFLPFVCEGIYQRLFAKHCARSVALDSWPQVKSEFMDHEAKKLGTLAKSIISALRQWKSGHGISLKEEIAEVVISCPEEVRERVEKIEDVVKGTAHVQKISFGNAGEIDLGEIKIDVRKS